MRRLALWLAFLLALGLALPAMADDAGEVEAEVTEEAEAAVEAEVAEEAEAAVEEEVAEEPEAVVEEAVAEEAEAAVEAEVTEEVEEDDTERGAFAEYGSEVGNRYLIGLNSFITFPADPVMSTVQPRDEFNQLPLAPVTKWPVGFVQGTILSVFRAYTGVLDLVFAPLTPMKMLSPEPRYLLFPNAEHDEY